MNDGASFFKAVQAGTRMGGLIDLQESAVKEKIKDYILERIEKYKVKNEYIIATPSIIVSAVKYS